MQVYSYWTGPQPDWIGMCLETLARNSPGAKILTADVWRDWYEGEIPVPVILRQRPNVQSDILRAWILARHGGIWIDADAIVWRQLSAISHWLDRYDFVAYRAAGHAGICSALIASQAGGSTASNYWSRIVAACQPGHRLKTLAIGPAMLRKSCLETGLARIKFLRPQWVHPLHWTKSSRLIVDERLPVANRAWCWMLTHNALGELSHSSRQDILMSDTAVAALFRLAGI